MMNKEQDMTEKHAAKLLKRLASFHGCKLMTAPYVRFLFSCGGEIAKHGQEFGSYLDVKDCKSFLQCYVKNDLKYNVQCSDVVWSDSFKRFSRLPVKSVEELELKLAVRGF